MLTKANKYAKVFIKNPRFLRRGLCVYSNMNTNLQIFPFGEFEVMSIFSLGYIIHRKFSIYYKFTYFYGKIIVIYYIFRN